MACRVLRLSSRRRCFSTTSSGEHLRVAIVGGGAAGLSSALHLAPLVEKGIVESPIDVFEPTTLKRREIGVGLWSTALEPFRVSPRNSHQLLWKDMTHYGRWVGTVGYRTPDGTWLAKSQLPTSIEDNMDMPGLLFLREMDMLASLRRAVHLEEMQGTVKMHHGDQASITGIQEDSPHSYLSGLLGGDCVTDRDYHLIVAADGMHSILRKRYGGHRHLHRFMGTAALLWSGRGQSPDTGSSWDATGQAEANAIEDRKYTVFHGNANLTHAKSGIDGESFQTWGVGKSMHFATVPLLYPSGEKQLEKEVWFLTTSDDSIAAKTDAVKRRDLLLTAFRDWHAPICQLVEATPPEAILFECGESYCGIGVEARTFLERQSQVPVRRMSDTLLVSTVKCAAVV